MQNTTNAIKILNPHYKRRDVIEDTDRKEHLSYIGEPFSGINEIVGLLPKDQIYLLKNYTNFISLVYFHLYGYI